MTGYIGPVVLQHLRKTLPNAGFRGIDTGFYLAQQDDQNVAPETLLDELIFKDVREIEITDFADVEAVVHLAAISNDPMGDRFAAVTHEINCLQSVRLAELAKQAGVRNFIFASSGSVYGAGGELPRSETSVLAPQTAYARSKADAETLLAGLADDSFYGTCFRFSTACGWSPRVRLDLVLNDFVAAAMTTGNIAVLSDGTPWRPLVHVTDMARAIEWGLTERRNVVPEQFFVVNVGNEAWNFQIRELAEAVARVIPGTTVHINADAPQDKRSYRVDFSRWETVAPNHQSLRELDETISELYLGLARVNVNPEFRTSHRVRLVTITALQKQNLINSELQWVNKLLARQN